ncbi:MAG: hypothetical protein ACI92C_001145, partial [Neolewinella sp.]
MILKLDGDKTMWLKGVNYLYGVPYGPLIFIGHTSGTL